MSFGSLFRQRYAIRPNAIRIPLDQTTLLIWIFNSDLSLTWMVNKKSEMFLTLKTTSYKRTRFNCVLSCTEYAAYRQVRLMCVSQYFKNYLVGVAYSVVANIPKFTVYIGVCGMCVCSVVRCVSVLYVGCCCLQGVFIWCPHHSVHSHPTPISHLLTDHCLWTFLQMANTRVVLERCEQFDWSSLSADDYHAACRWFHKDCRQEWALLHRTSLGALGFRFGSAFPSHASKLNDGWSE